MDKERTLTDADVQAIVDQFQTRLMQQFYADLGRGVWGWAKRIFVTAMLTIAAYGAVKGYGG